MKAKLMVAAVALFAFTAMGMAQEAKKECCKGDKAKTECCKGKEGEKKACCKETKSTAKTTTAKTAKATPVKK